MTNTAAIGDGRMKLAELDDQQRYEVFDQLQLGMPRVWNAMRLNVPNESVVVVPSVTLDRLGGGSGSLTQAYEERFLFLLLLLREPRLRMIYVTSMPIAPAIIEYYLALLPGVIPSHALSRLSLVSVGDSTPRPLSEKLLERPRLLRQIAALIPDVTLSHLVPYNTTALERDVALSLGIPMYGADPRLVDLGTKTGCRRLFAEEGVLHPLGFEDLHTLDELAHAIVTMRSQRTVEQVIVKLNESVSGQGNALVDLRGLDGAGFPDEFNDVKGRLQRMEFERQGTTLEEYLQKFGERGGIVEERLVGADIRSPSVQLRVTPTGQVELLSTHDQVLGGPSGQSYLGCRFPADFAYAREISDAARIIGERLAREGVIGRFAIDFVSITDGNGSWTSYAIELNLRKGGTTHPFLTLQFLTDGRYDWRSGLFMTVDGREKHLVATDHLESPSLRALILDDLFDIVARHRLHFDQARQTGVVFHMMSCLTEHGRVGLTAVGNSAAEANTLYERAERILLDEGADGQYLIVTPVAPARTLSCVETIDSDRRVTQPSGPIGWWYGGIIVDLIHMPIVLALVALGASKWNGPVYVGIISAIVIMQVALLGCPVLAITTWMKRKYDPEFPGGWSFTVWLYHRYGRWAGIAVFCFFLAVAIVVRLVAF